MSCFMVLAVRTSVIVVVELMTVIRPVEPVLVGPVRKAGKEKHVNKVGYVNRSVTVNMTGDVNKVGHVQGTCKRCQQGE